MDIQMDMQTDGQLERLQDRWIYRQKNGQSKKKTDSQMDREMVGHIDRQTDRLTTV